MDVPKIIRRLFGLNKLATDQAGTNEGDNAQRMMDAMLEKHGLSLPDGGLVQSETRVALENDWDTDLAVLISKATHTEAHIFKDAKEIRFRGIKIAVDEAVKHYEQQRFKMERIMGFSALGYMMGAFGEEAMEDHIKGSSEKSQTVEAGIEEAKAQAEKKSIFDEEPTEDEGEMVGAAGIVGAKDPVIYWKGLKK